MQRSYRYRERDHSFGQSMMRLRTTLGMTQIELAALLGVSRRAIQGWEGGISYPTPEHLKRFAEQCLHHAVFPAGREEEEVRVLWQQSRQKMPFDEAWVWALIHPPLPSSLPLGADMSLGTLSVSPTTPAMKERQQVQAFPRLDWLGALDVRHFTGREQELAEVKRWMVQERCRLVAVLGMGGIGKSALVSLLGQQLTPHFDAVLWRSVRDAPSCEALIGECITFFSETPPASFPSDFELLLNLLQACLQARRCLLVLDNLETLLLPGDREGGYRPGYQNYGRLIGRLAESTHQSCILLTSREKPREIEPVEGLAAPVRTLRLSGLNEEAARDLLADKGLSGTTREWTHLVSSYAGNPLALKIVAQTISDLFGGEVAPFLRSGDLLFNGIRAILRQQVDRLTPLEQEILTWLAVVREWTALERLLHWLTPRATRTQILEALQALRRRSLLERGAGGRLTLQSVVMEYMTQRLVAQLHEDVRSTRAFHLRRYPLEQATAKEYVRLTQVRLLVHPLIEQLRRELVLDRRIEELLLYLLEQFRREEGVVQGYGPANVIALLKALRGHLRSLDLSCLALQEAYLQGIDMQDTTLAQAQVDDASFTDTGSIFYRLAISPDGALWAAGAINGDLRIYRAGGVLLHWLSSVHAGPMPLVAISPNGQLLASGGNDGLINLWEPQRGTLTATLRDHTGRINDLAFSPDGRYLISGSSDCTVCVWECEQRQRLLRLSGHDAVVLAVAWSPDGTQLASAGEDGQILLWEARSGRRLGQYWERRQQVGTIAFRPDGIQLASGGSSSIITLWDLTNQQAEHHLEGHTGYVFKVVFSPAGDQLASCSYDGTLRLWELPAGRPDAVLLGHAGPVYACAFTPDGTHLLSGGGDSTLRLWDITGRACELLLHGYDRTLCDIAWSPDGREVTCGSSEGVVTLWSVRDGKARLRLRHPGMVRIGAWSPDGTLLASACVDGVIRLWETQTGSCWQILEGHSSMVMGVAWSPDGTRLASVGADHTVRVWDVASLRCCWLRRQGAPLRCVAWHPDGRWVISGSDEQVVLVWHPADGTLLARLDEPDGAVYSLAWHPAGTAVACCDASQQFSLWEEDGGVLRASSTHPPLQAGTIAWSPEGALLVSADMQGQLQWWDVQTWRCVQERHIPSEPMAVSVSPDGMLVATTSRDGLFRLWDRASAEVVRILHLERPYERLNIRGVRGLTPAQRETLLALGAEEAPPGEAQTPS